MSTPLKLGEAGVVPERTPAPVSAAPPGPPPATLAPALHRLERPPARPVMVSLAAALASAAAGWMLAGAFVGMQPRVVAVLAGVLGGGFVALSHLTRRPAVLQVLALPAAMLAGALLAAPGLSGGAGSLPSQIEQTIRDGGLSEPPVAFDPGWRFLLVVLIAALAVTAATLALWSRRPQLAVVVPLPLLVAGILVQPPGDQVLGVVVSLALLGAALAVAYGAQLAQEGVTGGSFELRRFLQAAAMGVVLVAVLVSVGNAGFLLPKPQQSSVIPPRKPETSPPISDHVLFTVKGGEDDPLRLGVLDVYQDNQWMTPPYDTKLFEKLGPGGTVPSVTTSGTSPRAGAPSAPASNGPPITVTIHAEDIQGRALPDLAGLSRISGYDGSVVFDPRGQVLRTDGRIPNGATYTLTAEQPPTGDELAKVPASTDPDLAPFLAAPTAPYAVQNLLLKMPSGLTPYATLAYLRKAYYGAAVAAGPGNPVPVPPQKVADILAGRPASPYEIAAGEVLLARWAGIPARLGYGYYGGDKQSDGTRTIRPKDGAMWLEAYFSGYGWVPILGVPQHAKPSLTANPKNHAQIQATDQLGADVYVPIQLPNLRALFTSVRYWVVRLLPWALGIALLWFAFPGLVKMTRRRVRFWWARRHGPVTTILAEYAELRDYANDLNVGHPTMTPIEFLDAMQPDDVHTELAWLVSRALWGDLRRDLRPEDAAHGARMARAMRRRLFAGQPIIMRLLAFGSRVSLHEPYTAEIPTLWPGADDTGTSVGVARARQARSLSRRLRRWRPRRGAWRRLRRKRWHRPRLGWGRLGWGAVRVVAAVAVAGLFALLVVTGGIRNINLSSDAATVAAAQRVFPKVPDQLLDITFEREPDSEQAFHDHAGNALVSDGRFYALRQKGIVVATLQMAVYKPGVAAVAGTAKAGLLGSLGNGAFTVSHLNGEQFYEQSLAEVKMIVWFAPDTRYYELVIAKNGFDKADQLFANLLNYQRTGSRAAITVFSGTPPLDPRRGAP